MLELISHRDNNKTYKHINDAIQKVKRGLRQGLAEIGRENKKHLKLLIKNPPKTGRFYGKHQASAPGQAPANWTGALLKSVKYEASDSDSVTFGEEKIYGKYLEDGTKTEEGAVRIKPRPHVIRTVNEKSKDNYNSINHAVHRSVHQ